MNEEEFKSAYIEIAKKAFNFAELTRKNGLLAVEENLDKERIKDRDLFEYGIQFVVDGIDRELIDKILSNLIEQEPDTYKHKLKNMEKEAVLAIQEGLNPRMVVILLNSLTQFSLKDDPVVQEYKGDLFYSGSA
jgi:flagellar motor component MotA